MRDMGKALLDANGKLRTFEDFKREAQTISGMQLNWLRTEYDTAVGAAQMASKWVEIQEQKNLFPLLEFDAVIDKHTSDLCGSLNGVIRPVDDEFWKQYYPPNHFNCRSTVRQLRTGEITPTDKIIYPEKMPAIFKVNLGEQGLAFPADSPYYVDMPADVMFEARKLMPYDRQFDVLENDGVGLIRQHFMVNTKASDYNRILEIAKDKVKGKMIVDIMPTLNPNKYSKMRDIIFVEANQNKSPDLKINNIWVEEEFSTNPKGKNNISGAIKAGAEQANHIIISLNEAIGKEKLEQIAKGQFNIKRYLSIIEFRFNGKYWLFENPY